MRRWTPEEEEELIELYASDLPVRQIAEKLGRPLRAVYTKATKLKIAGKKEDPNKIHLDVEQLGWLRRAFPVCRTEICALRLGISHRSVIRIARRQGLTKSPEFMKEAQAYTAQKAKESHLRNGTYPPRGVVNDNLAKGAAYRFKPRQQRNQNQSNNPD